MYEKWREMWTQLDTCRQTKQFYNSPDQNRGKKIIKLARSQLSLYVKLVTGHNNLSYHASKIDPTIDPTCALCQEEDETFFHFLTVCPRLRITRENLGIIETDSGTWTPERLLEFARVPAIEALLNRF